MPQSKDLIMSEFEATEALPAEPKMPESIAIDAPVEDTAELHENQVPAPDAIFIGGGLSDPRVFEAAWEALKPGGRLVANTVSLASEARLIELFGRHGGELVRLEVSRSGKAGNTGNVFVWRPASPIVQWRVRKP